MTPAVAQGGRRDAVRNYHRILDAARDVLGESGAEASMEKIATRAGVGVGTVYRRFASKDALIDELVRLVMEEVTAAADRALTRDDGHGLEEFLRALGQSFTGHARYANLLLERPVSPCATERLRATIAELTDAGGRGGNGGSRHHRSRRHGAHPGPARLVQATPTPAQELPPQDWQRFLGMHLAGMRAAHSFGTSCL